MGNVSISTNIERLQPPYKVIMHGNKIGVLIGIQTVTFIDNETQKIKNRNFPLVAVEKRDYTPSGETLFIDGNGEGRVWDNVETHKVSELFTLGSTITWEDFLSYIWLDEAREDDESTPLKTHLIFQKICDYKCKFILPSFGQHTIHLHSRKSDNKPHIIYSAEKDTFALKVQWCDNLDKMVERIISNLHDYLHIISPNHKATMWTVKYETNEEQLRPLVEKLNANIQATSFKNVLVGTFELVAIPTYEDEKETLPSAVPQQENDTQKPQMAESVIDKISANNIRYYYEGWRNGKHGSICQKNGIYRFVEMAYGKSGILYDVIRKEEDNPIVAKGIVAYWLQFNSRMDIVIKRLTKYNCEIPKDIKEQFDNYTQIRFEQFRQDHRDDPNTWDWDWDWEFYANVIIPHEMAFNKLSEALFDYISDSDIVLVRGVMNSYIKYLKKIRTEKGYQVNPELLVLRAIESGDKTKQEDLEEYEVNTILDKLEEKRYVKVAWIEGHKPEDVRLLDKGRYYLKQLEEEGRVVDTEPVVKQQQQPKEDTTENPPQTSYIPQAPIGSGQEENEGEGYNDENESQDEWNTVYDSIFDPKLNPQAIAQALKNINSVHLPKNERGYWWVFLAVLTDIKWMNNPIHKKVLQWANFHFNCGWDWNKDNQFRFADIHKNIKNQSYSEWSKETTGTNLGVYYRELAKKMKESFVNVTDTGVIYDKPNFFLPGKECINKVSKNGNHNPF